MDMDMGTTATHAMDMATGTSTMAMASSTSMSHDMGGMDMGGSDMGMSMSMSDMIMVFFTSSSTPLFSNSWTPSNQGQYAGTCIFLIALACIMRLLLALRPILEARFWSNNVGPGIEADDLLAHQEAQAKKVPGQAVTLVRRDVGRRWSGWRVGPSAARATFELIVAGVGYLLMLSVMTMNVGYFISVLGGVWLGTFLLGNLAYIDGWSHTH